MKNAIMTFCIVVFMFIFGITVSCIEENKSTYKEEKKEVIQLDSFTVDRLILEMFKDSILYPEIVLNQSKLETGHYTSRVFKENNNLFGFMTKDGYLKFNHWSESVSYYAKWQRKWYHGGNYYSFLERINYAQDSTYVATLKQMSY